MYRAWDPRLEREVALKILHERSEVDPDRVWRFVAEARTASALNHPNILTVFDANRTRSDNLNPCRNRMSIAAVTMAADPAVTSGAIRIMALRVESTEDDTAARLASLGKVVRIQ